MAQIHVVNLESRYLSTWMEQFVVGLRSNYKSSSPNISPGDICIIRCRRKGRDYGKGPVAIWYLRAAADIEYVRDQALEGWSPSTGWIWRIQMQPLVVGESCLDEGLELLSEDGFFVDKLTLYEEAGLKICTYDLDREWCTFERKQHIPQAMLTVIARHWRSLCEHRLAWYMDQKVNVLALLEQMADSHVPPRSRSRPCEQSAIGHQQKVVFQHAPRSHSKTSVASIVNLQQKSALAPSTGSTDNDALRTRCEHSVASQQGLQPLSVSEQMRGSEAVDEPRSCEATHKLEAVHSLEGVQKECAVWYNDFSREHGRRPTAVDASLAGYNPRAAWSSHGGWLGFVRSQGGLTDAEKAVFAVARAFLENLEVSKMTKSYKMVVLAAMIAEGQMPGSMGVGDLVEAVARLLREEPRLRDDFPVDVLDARETEGAWAGVAEEGKRATREAHKRLEALLRKNPLHFMSTGPSSPYFSLNDGSFTVRVDVPIDGREALTALTQELIHWRLEDYLRRPGRALPITGTQFYCEVVRNAGGKPILVFDRTKSPGIPSGKTPVSMDGEAYEAVFLKAAVNAVCRPRETRNVLPDLLTLWFGRHGGSSGRVHRVVFTKKDGTWVLARCGY